MPRALTREEAQPAVHLRKTWKLWRRDGGRDAGEAHYEVWPGLKQRGRRGGRFQRRYGSDR